MNDRHLHFYEYFTFLPVFAANYFAFEVRKRDRGFSICFHYCLLLIILLYRQTNANLKICRYIRLHIKEYAEGFIIKQLFEIMRIFA